MNVFVSPPSISTLNVLPESAVTECSAGSEFLTAIVAPAGTDSGVLNVKFSIVMVAAGAAAGAVASAVADVAASAEVVAVVVDDEPQAVTVAAIVNAAPNKSPILLMG